MFNLSNKLSLGWGFHRHSLFSVVARQLFFKTDNNSPFSTSKD